MIFLISSQLSSFYSYKRSYYSKLLPVQQQNKLKLANIFNLLKGEQWKILYRLFNYCELDMSDEMKQMMAIMMQQLQQQQIMINKLTNELAEQKNKNKSLHTNIINPIYFGSPAVQPPNHPKPPPVVEKDNSTSKIQCPKKHKAYRIYGDRRLCNECNGYCDAGKKCSVCSFTVCRQCQKLNHKDLCLAPKQNFYKDKHFCYSCGEERVGGTKCECSFTICIQCKPLKHSEFCKTNDNFTDYSDYQFCLGCNTYEQAGKYCNNCYFRQCKGCKWT